MTKVIILSLIDATGNDEGLSNGDKIKKKDVSMTKTPTFLSSTCWKRENTIVLAAYLSQ